MRVMIRGRNCALRRGRVAATTEAAVIVAAEIRAVILVEILAVIREAEAGGEVGLEAEVDRLPVAREIQGRTWRTILS